MECGAFTVADLQPAARLVAERVAALRRLAPDLPGSWEAPDAWAARLAAFTADGRAVAARDDGRLVGFLAAERHPEQARAYSPEWANATIPGGRRVLEALYANAARGWVAEDLRVHVIGTMCGQPGEAETFAWLGFGTFVVDAVRGIDPLPEAGADVTVRRATIGDLDAVVALEDGLRRHLLASPVFLVLPPPQTLDEHRVRLADPGTATLVAEDASGLLAHLRIGPCADDVATIVRDVGTASITAAFTLADRRGVGVATTLLDAGLAWARGQGYARCGVDFESANLEAARFWSRWFRPVTTWQIRRLHSQAGADVR